MIRLHDYWRSSASYRVRIALGLAGLQWQSVSVDLVAGDQGQPGHLARNPQGLVPVLEIDGLLLTQSLAIIEYLDETRGLALLPQVAGERARVRALAHALAMEIAPICNLSVRSHVAALTQGSFGADDWQRHYIAKGLAAFESMLGQGAPGALCHGDVPTLPDICLVPQVYNARRVGLDVGAFPRIQQIVTRLEALPAFAAAHPDHHKP